MTPVRDSPRVAAVLLGDVTRQPEARTKYGLLFEALGACLPLVEVHDASLRGLRRLASALRTFRPDRERWRQHFRRDIRAFRSRSRLVAGHLRSLTESIDVVFQLGVLLDARWRDLPLPSVIYTDYTARLSARHPSAGRSPLGPRKRERWIRLETQAYRRASQVCTRSEFVRQSLIDDYGLPPEMVVAVGGGINFSPLPTPAERHETAAPTALFIGKKLWRKGGDVLLRAFAQARADVPRARLLLVTGDPVPTGLPLDGVTVVPPTWDRHELSELYRRADLFVLPSRLETWGDVLLEAMAHGLPCIGTSGEAMEEIISAGQTGMLVPPEDQSALTAALVQLFREPGLRRDWGEAARRRVAAEFTWEVVADRLRRFLEEAANRRSL